MNHIIRNILFTIIGIILSILFFTITVPILLIITIIHFIKKFHHKNDTTNIIIEGTGRFV